MDVKGYTMAGTERSTLHLYRDGTIEVERVEADELQRLTIDSRGVITIRVPMLTITCPGSDGKPVSRTF